VCATWPLVHGQPIAERVRVLAPLQHAALLRERHYLVRADHTQLAHFLVVAPDQIVDGGKELLHHCVLAQVIAALD